MIIQWERNISELRVIHSCFCLQKYSVELQTKFSCHAKEKTKTKRKQTLNKIWRASYFKKQRMKKKLLLKQKKKILITIKFPSSSIILIIWCRCLHKSQTFPPGRSIWCNNNRKGPTARPTAAVGGHACCSSADFCNMHLKPIILDYRKTPVKEYIQGGIFIDILTISHSHKHTQREKYPFCFSISIDIQQLTRSRSFLFQIVSFSIILFNQRLTLFVCSFFCDAKELRNRKEEGKKNESFASWISSNNSFPFRCEIFFPSPSSSVFIRMIWSDFLQRCVVLWRLNSNLKSRLF